MSDFTQYLETCIVPVCRFEKTIDGLVPYDFFGTAFFIRSSGVFLTAKHVLTEGKSAVENKSGFLGLCARPPGSTESVACPILYIEDAAEPYDISVGTIEARFNSFLTLENVPVTVWREVASFGYPATAQNRSNQELWMYGRGFRGYLHREVNIGQLPGKPHPDLFETSFSMPQGLSGSPLFITSHSSSVAIGVCVGINRGETTEYVFEEVQDNGEIFKEKRVRVEEYGIAHDLRNLLDWRPSILNGRSLAEVAAN